MTQEANHESQLIANNDDEDNTLTGKGKGSLKAAQLIALPVEDWSCEHVLLWLQGSVFNASFLQNNNASPLKSSSTTQPSMITIEQQVENYIESFASNDVSGAVLLTLSADDIKELGVTKLGHRRTLELALAKLKDEKAAQLEAQNQRAAAATQNNSTTPKRTRNTSEEYTNEEKSSSKKPQQSDTAAAKRQKTQPSTPIKSNSNNGSNDSQQHTQVVDIDQDETMDEETRKLIKQLQEEDAQQAKQQAPTKTSNISTFTLTGKKNNNNS